MFRPLCLLALSIVLLSSCKKKKTPPNPTPTPSGPNYEDSLKQGLYAHYTFSGGSLADSSGNGRNMRLVNGTSFTADRTNNANNALSFDGQDDFAVIDGSTTFSSEDFTVSLQIYPQRVTGGRFFNKGNFNNANGVGTTFGFDDDAQTNKLIFTVNRDANLCSNIPGSNSLIYMYSDPLIAQNVWYNLVVSFINGVQYLYINGELVEMQATGLSGLRTCTNSPFYFGIWWLQDLKAYQGRMDNIRIYSRALTAAELKYMNDRNR